MYATKHPEELQDKDIVESKDEITEEASKPAQAVSAASKVKQALDPQRKEWLSKLNIFQRYREVREQHALENWRRHSLEWHKIEQFVSKTVRKVY